MDDLIIPARGPQGVQGLPGGLAQTVFLALAIDKSTTAAVGAPAAFMSQAITTSGGALEVWFSATGSNDTNNVHDNVFQLLVDGVVVASRGFTAHGAGHNSSVPIHWKTAALAAGVHTVAVKWYTGGGTLSVLAATDPGDGATLLIHEVTT